MYFTKNQIFFSGVFNRFNLNYSQDNKEKDLRTAYHFIMNDFRQFLIVKVIKKSSVYLSECFEVNHHQTSLRVFYLSVLVLSFTA